MKKFIIITCSLLAINSCTKDEPGVFIRVQNSTSTNFKAVLNNNKVFENVAASATTVYQHFESALGLPGATLITNNNDTLIAGYIYFDWMEALADGKYTLRIFKDTATLSDFNAEYIQN